VARFLAQIVLNGFVLWLVAQLGIGIHFSGGVLELLVLGLIFGLVNGLLKPVLQLVSLPFTILTLGLFALVVNTALLGLTAALSPAYSINGFFSAFIGSILVSIISTALNRFIKDQ
jgi:putative membrane protein